MTPPDDKSRIVWRLDRARKGRYVQAARAAGGLSLIEWIRRCCDHHVRNPPPPDSPPEAPQPPETTP